MQFSNIFVIAALATGVFSHPTAAIRSQRRDLHSEATCSTGRDAFTNELQFDDEITKKACAAYKADRTGSGEGAQCRDCTAIEIEGSTTFCGSTSESIGGKEWEALCQAFGGDRGHANGD